MKIHYNYPAAWTLVGSVAVVCGKRNQALLVWALCQVKQKTFPAEIPLSLTTKQCSVLKGFFTSIAAVLHTIAMSLSRLLGRKDRLNRLPEQRPHGGKLSDHTRLQDQSEPALLVIEQSNYSW